MVKCTIIETFTSWKYDQWFLIQLVAILGKIISYYFINNRIHCFLKCCSAEAEHRKSITKLPACFHVIFNGIDPDGTDGMVCWFFTWPRKTLHCTSSGKNVCGLLKEAIQLTKRKYLLHISEKNYLRPALHWRSHLFSLFLIFKFWSQLAKHWNFIEIISSRVNF